MIREVEVGDVYLYRNSSIEDSPLSQWNQILVVTYEDKRLDSIYWGRLLEFQSYNISKNKWEPHHSGKLISEDYEMLQKNKYMVYLGNINEQLSQGW